MATELQIQEIAKTLARSLEGADADWANFLKLADEVAATYEEHSEKPIRERTGAGLRDALFDQIDSLRSGRGNPTQALAVANLAKQIVQTAKAEFDFLKHAKEEREGLGQLRLGGPPAADAVEVVTDRSQGRTRGTRE